MLEPYRSLFAFFVVAWMGGLVLGKLAVRFWMQRLGRTRAWEPLQIFAPLLDLFGTWAGTLGCVALALGRQGFSLAWAGALGILAVMITATLYDRAVLMPSLDAALRRLAATEEADAADGTEKWERDWAFLWRMAVLGRWLTLILGVVALLLGLRA